MVEPVADTPEIAPSGAASTYGGSNEIRRIIREIVDLQAADPGCDQPQFRSLASALQYVRVYRAVLEHVPRRSHVLDWGCGTGHFSFGLQRLGYRVCGFGFEDFAFRSHIGPEFEFVQGNPDSPTALPFEDAGFDAVLSVGVLEHVRDTGGSEAGSLREIQRILKPGGLFVCAHLPNRYGIIEAVAKAFPNKHHHLHRYTRASVEEMCDAAGLELMEITRYGALPRNMWNRLPMRQSRVAAAIWGGLDATLRYPLMPLNQNYLFVARRRSGEKAAAVNAP